MRPVQLTVQGSVLCVAWSRTVAGWAGSAMERSTRRKAKSSPAQPVVSNALLEVIEETIDILVSAHCHLSIHTGLQTIDQAQCHGHCTTH